MSKFSVVDWLKSYNEYRVLELVSRFATNDEILLYTSEEKFIQLGRNFRVDFKYYLENGLFKKLKDLENVRNTISDIKEDLFLQLQELFIEPETGFITDIHVADKNSAILYSFLSDITTMIEYNKFNASWDSSYSKLFDKHSGLHSIIKKIWKMHYMNDSKLVSLDNDILNFISDKLVLYDNSNTKQSIKSLRTNRINTLNFHTTKIENTDNDNPRTNKFNTGESFKTGNYYYVNELEKIRFDADSAVCKIINKKLDDFIRDIGDDSEFITQIETIKDTFEEPDFRDIPDVVQLFPDINAGILSQQKRDKMKYLVVFLNASNIMSVSDWDYIKSIIASSQDVDVDLTLDSRRLQILNTIVNETANSHIYEYLQTLDFNDTRKFYGINPKEYADLYRCRRYIEIIVEAIVEYTPKYRSMVMKLFTDDAILSYYQMFYVENIEYASNLTTTLIRNIKIDANNRRREARLGKIVSKMVEYTFDKVENEPSITLDMVTKILKRKYNQVTSGIAYLITEETTEMLMLAAAATTNFISCLLCDKPAIGACCKIGVYCSTKCQKQDYFIHSKMHQIE